MGMILIMGYFFQLQYMIPYAYGGEGGVIFKSKHLIHVWLGTISAYIYIVAHLLYLEIEMILFYEIVESHKFIEN